MHKILSIFHLSVSLKINFARTEKREDLQKEGDVKITFTMAPEDDEMSDEKQRQEDQNHNQN